MYKRQDLTLAQSQYELVAYGVFVGTLYGIIGLAATLAFFENNHLLYLLWITASVAVIYSIFSVIRKYELIASYVISIAPPIVVAFCSYEAFLKKSSFLTLTIFLCLFLLTLKYSWRVIKIVFWQRHNNYSEINIKKKA